MSEKITVEVLRERLAKIIAMDSVEERDEFFNSLVPTLSPETIEVIRESMKIAKHTNQMARENSESGIFLSDNYFDKAQQEFNAVYGGGSD